MIKFSEFVTEGHVTTEPDGLYTKVLHKGEHIGTVYHTKLTTSAHQRGEVFTAHSPHYGGMRQTHKTSKEAVDWIVRNHKHASKNKKFKQGHP